MCNANLLGVGSLAMSTAGALTSSFGAYGESRAQKQALQYGATVDRNNAMLAEWQAADALNRGEKSWQKHNLDVAALKGTQRAVLASHGVALDEGSAARILSDTDFLGALDAQTIRNNAAKESFGYEAQATQYKNDAAMKDYGASGIHPKLAGLTTLLSGGASVASKWYSMSTVGV
ncbi:MAG: hypothetical protein ABL879_15340 [Devosia sp.]